MHKRIGFLSIFIFFLLESCTQKTVEPFNPPISEDKMINVLIDVHLAEAALQTLPRIYKDSMATVLYGQIYKFNEIKEEDLYEALDAYDSYPHRLKNLYEKVIDEINIREAKLNKKIDRDITK